MAPSLGLSEGTWIQAWAVMRAALGSAGLRARVLDFKEVLKDRLP